MPLESGSRLGPYEIIRLLGAGGMGEVYRARDARLGRDVAIKVLPAAAAGAQESLARFEREAKVLASLNHPNIAQILGLEESNGAPAIVMELVEGRTLEQVLRDAGAQARSASARGGSHPDGSSGLAIEDALRIVRQIADALEAAHEQGIIHRDLKPANVKVRDDGVVKVLDFGLAKMLAPAPASGVMTEESATTMASTEVGTILGTAAYMSPEQARGRSVDRRADIWAFGCVLYELLAGRRAFTGETTVDLLAAIMHNEPDWSALPAATPPAIARLVRRMLAKDEKQRLQAIGDARLEIEECETGVSGPIAPIPAAPGRGRRGVWAAIAGIAFLLGVAATAALLWSWGRHQLPRPVTRLAIPLAGIDGLADSTLGSILAVAPDGRTIVFAAVRRGVTQLYRRALDEPAPSPIAGTEGAQDPFFSPDGTWVGFAAGRKLKRFRLGSDGPPTDICDVQDVLGASWGLDDTIVFGSRTGLRRVAAAGGTPEIVTTLGPNDIGHGLPQLLPGGMALVYWIDRGNIDAIAVYSLEDRKTRELMAGSAVRYAATGHLVFLRGETLWAVPFDAVSRRLTGEAVQLVDRPRSSLAGGAAHYGFGADGAFVYVTEGTSPDNVPTWEDAGGNRSPLAVEHAHYQDVALSPDGTRVALDTAATAPGSAPGVIWVYDIARRTSMRLSGGFPNPASAPVWSADGREIVFSSWRENRMDLFVQAADATRPAEPLTNGSGFRIPCFMTRDGKTIGFVALRLAGTDYDLMVLSRADHVERPLLRTPASETNATLSPDGRFMAYQSDESGRFEIHVRTFPDVDKGHWVISADGGEDPRWARSGRVLYYRSDRRIMMANVRTSPVFEAEPARVRLESRLTLPSDPRVDAILRRRTYDVADNDARMLMLEDVAAVDDRSVRSAIVVVQNWVEQLHNPAASRK